MGRENRFDFYLEISIIIIASLKSIHIKIIQIIKKKPRISHNPFTKACPAKLLHPGPP